MYFDLHVKYFVKRLFKENTTEDRTVALSFSLLDSLISYVSKPSLLSSYGIKNLSYPTYVNAVTY